MMGMLVIFSLGSVLPVVSLAANSTSGGVVIIEETHNCGTETKHCGICNKFQRDCTISYTKISDDCKTKKFSESCNSTYDHDSEMMGGGDDSECGRYTTSCHSMCENNIRYCETVSENCETKFSTKNCSGEGHLEYNEDFPNEDFAVDEDFPNEDFAVDEGFPDEDIAVLSGKILNKDGNPLAGFTVQIGVQTTVTDETGFWEISIPKGDYTLNVSKDDRVYVSQHLIVEGDYLVLDDIRIKNYPIPTLSEWGLIIFMLMLTTIGILFTMRRQAMIAAMSGGIAEGTPPPVLVPAVFIKALTITGLLALIGFAISIGLSSSLPTTTDIVGTLISAPIFAYLIHLLMIFKRQ
jgi:hypothetical protein